MALDRVHTATGPRPVRGAKPDVVEQRLGGLGERHRVIGIHQVAVVIDPLVGNCPAAGIERAHCPRQTGGRRSANALGPSRASAESSMARYAGSAPDRSTEKARRM